MASIRPVARGLRRPDQHAAVDRDLREAELTAARARSPPSSRHRRQARWFTIPLEGFCRRSFC
jgi:hypothetical protein